MVEFEVDMACLLEDGELDRVVLHDENGEHPSMQFEPSRGTCQLVKATWDEGSIEHGLECTACGYRSTFASEYWNYCPDCGRKVVKQ